MKSLKNHIVESFSEDSLNESSLGFELKKGEMYTMDSGMGGRFSYKFVGIVDGRYVFKNKTKGWEKQNLKTTIQGMLDGNIKKSK